MLLLLLPGLLLPYRLCSYGGIHPVVSFSLCTFKKVR
jgi:hypothetical protein